MSRIPQDMRQDAIYAFHILNYFVGDLVAAAAVRQHYQSPSISKKIGCAAVGCVNRICISHLILTLAKWDEFYRYFRCVIPQDCRDHCKRLCREIERRKIKSFRNKFVGHIWDKEKRRPLTDQEIDDAVNTIVENNQDGFALWCNNPKGNVFPNTIVSIVEHTRDRIGEEYCLSRNDLSTGSNNA